VKHNASIISKLKRDHCRQFHGCPDSSNVWKILLKSNIWLTFYNSS